MFGQHDQSRTAVVQELLDRAATTWLSSIGINDGWGSIWWNEWDDDELVSLKRRLCLVHRPATPLGHDVTCHM